MQSYLRCGLILLLCWSLAASPALASPAAMVGTVVQANAARLGPSQLLQGSTLFDGDTLSTGPTGNVIVFTTQGQLALLADTTVSLTRRPTGISAVLERGQAIVSSESPSAIEVRAGQIVIRAHSAVPTRTHVIRVGPKELIVSAIGGEAEVSLDGETRVVPPNTSYRVLVDASAEASPAAGSQRVPRRAGKSRLLILILGATAAVTAYTVYRALVSPDTP